MCLIIMIQIFDQEGHSVLFIYFHSACITLYLIQFALDDTENYIIIVLTVILLSSHKDS